MNHADLILDKNFAQKSTPFPTKCLGGHGIAPLVSSHVWHLAI